MLRVFLSRLFYIIINRTSRDTSINCSMKLFQYFTFVIERALLEGNLLDRLTARKQEGDVLPGATVVYGEIPSNMFIHFQEALQ